MISSFLNFPKLGHVKLADFGASGRVKFGETQNISSFKGTPFFMAPEVLAKAEYGRKGDIWALGCTVIQMFSGSPPWKDAMSSDCHNFVQGLVQLSAMLAQLDGNYWQHNL